MGDERIVLLDALRGFALLGVLLSNLRDFTLFGFLSDSAKAALPSAGFDHWFDFAVAATVDGKAFTIFTILFGVGFALQMKRSTDSKQKMRRYIRRLSILFGIGLAHAYLFWWGDILRLYAVMGLALVPLARLKPRTMAVLGVIVAVFLTPWLRPAMAALLPTISSAQQTSAAALSAFTSESIAMTLKGNFSYDVWTRISAWGLPIYILGRLTIGVAIGRAGALDDPSTHAGFWRRLLMVTLPVGIALTAFVVLKDHGLLASTSEWWRSGAARAIVRLSRSAGSLSLGLAYIAIFVGLFQREAWHRWLQILGPVGRMALTNYLMQAVFAIPLFYGFGLGIGPRFGFIGIVVACAGIFAIQVALSHWWLARFNFGPAEWLWRCLTYGYRPPMRRIATA